MKNGKYLVWILDDEWTDHSVEKAIYDEHGFDVIVTRSETFNEDLYNYAPYADGVVAQVGFHCGAELIAKLDSCRIITASAVGFNHIDIEAATRKNILVSHIPDYCSEEVSDHAVTLMLAITRHLSAYQNQVRKGQYNPFYKNARRFCNQTVGMLGFGEIARKVAEKLKPFGVRLISYDPYLSLERFKENGIEAVSFEELLRQSNILSLHVPLIPETRNMISYKQLKKMPKDSFIINTCRGGVINEEDLYQSILEGHTAGAGLDVLLNEPPNPKNPLLHMDEVLVTPHSAYVSEDAIIELKSKTSHSIIAGITGKPLLNSLNSQVSG